MKYITLLCFLLIGCGGGGDGYTMAPDELAPWEWKKGVCSFDSDEARAQAIREGANCNATLIGNKLNGEPWPPVSWPSTPVLWRAQ